MPRSMSASERSNAGRDWRYGSGTSKFPKRPSRWTRPRPVGKIRSTFRCWASSITRMRSNALAISVVSWRARCPERSMPRSRINSSACCSAGSPTSAATPADCTTRRPARCERRRLRRAAAMGLRQTFPMQTNNTLRMSAPYTNRSVFVEGSTLNSPLRAAPRYAASLRVAFSRAEGFPSDQLTQISARAMFVRTDRRLPVGTWLLVALGLPDPDRPGPVQAKLVHLSYARSSLSKAGVSVQLVSSADPFRARLDRYIDGTLPRSKTPALRLLSIARSGLVGSPLQRNLDEQLRSPMRLGVDLQPSSQCDRAVADPRQTHASSFSTPEDAWVEAHAIVLDQTGQPGQVAAEFDGHVLGARMPGHVGERLLDDPVQRGLDVRCKPLFHETLEMDGNTRALGDPLGEELQRRHQPQIIQHRRPQVTGDSPQLLIGPIEDGADLRHALLHRGARSLSRGRRHRQPRCVEELPGLVMDSESNPLHLAFHLFVQLAESQSRFAGSAMGQLIGRKCVGKKVARPAKPILEGNRSGEADQDSAERLVVHCRQLEHADALRDGPSSDLAGPARRCLACADQISFECIGIDQTQLTERELPGRNDAATRKQFVHGRSAAESVSAGTGAIVYTRRN